MLYQKQGRNTQFGSEAERDEWIRQEMEQLEKTQHKRQEQLKSLGQEIAQLNSDLMDLSQVSTAHLLTFAELCDVWL